MARGTLLAAAILINLYLMLPGGTHAQQSASFKIKRAWFAAGSSPGLLDGPSSSSYRISFESIGAHVEPTQMQSPSFRLDGGPAAFVAPVGEIVGLGFDAAGSLGWERHPAAEVYHLYRGLVGDLDGRAYGACLQAAIADPGAVDAETPAVGGAFFYLVTGENCLAEEGTRGTRSDGSPRPGVDCP